MANKQLVIIESPYKSKSRWWIVRVWERWRNCRYANECIRDSIFQGEFPFASHILYTTALDDDDASQRYLGIEAGLAWGQQAHITAVYTDFGISEGMRYGIERAKREGRPVEYRKLYR